MEKPAITASPINDLARKRWSPRAFLDRPVETEKLISLFEAARWSPSGGNEQPWRFIVGRKPDETWEKIYSALDDGNREWNHHVPVLILACANKISNWDGNISAFYQYDAGQAVAHLSLEASNQGLHVHQMGGFYAEKCHELFEIPDTIAVMTVIAAGYLGNPEMLNEKYYKREIQPRVRQELPSMVFGGRFGTPFIF